jgi:inosose dehydratase
LRLAAERSPFDTPRRAPEDSPLRGSTLHRLASGPISWGVCEVPGWGAELPPDRVLAEMASLGLGATEAGPDGYLGTDPAEVAALLGRHGLRLVGGFLPVVLHDPAGHAMSVAAARRVGGLFAEAGGTFLVSAIVTDLQWSARVTLSGAQWRSVFDGLARLDEVAAEYGLAHVSHPHWGTLVETRDDVSRLLEGCDTLLCLDTGHLTLGGTDPVWLVGEGGDRIAHVHLKDVDETVAARLRSRELPLVAAVRRTLFRPLGEGDTPIADTVRALEAGGYRGWYVLEQDLALTSADVPPGQGPIEGVRRSIEFLRALTGDAQLATAPGRR